jgi:mRNA interferase RelE/StbE
VAYTIEFSPRAKRQLKKLPREDQQTCAEIVRALKADPRPDGCKKLKEEENIYRVRLSKKKRICYTINDKDERVTVLALGPRDQIYRML